MGRKIVVFGSGGFAREVRWLISDLAAAGQAFEFAGFVISDRSKLGANDSANEVVGDIEWLRDNRARIDGLAIGIGTPSIRLKVREDLSAFGPEMWPALVHPSVRLDRASCEIGEGVLVCAGTIATVGVKLRPFSILNLSCTIGHEAVIGRGSVLNPSVNISGGVTIGDGVLVGTGAQVLQYLTVGDVATIGAGAVVTKDVAPGVTVAGIPAKPLGAK